MPMKKLVVAALVLVFAFILALPAYAAGITEIGVVPNDASKATANAIALNNYFAGNKNKTVACDAADYYIDNTITVTSSNALTGKHGTRFILTTTDVDAFMMRPSAIADTFTVVLPKNHTMAGIKVGPGNYDRWGASNRRYQGVNNIFIVGTRNDAGEITSTGLHMDAPDGVDAKNKYPLYNVTNWTGKVTTLRCAYGVKITNTGAGWVNANSIASEVIDCITGIYTEGSGNTHHHMVQTSEWTKAGVHIKGGSNVFIGKVWDADKGQPMYLADVGSRNNTVIGDYHDYFYCLTNGFIIDRGLDNIWGANWNRIKDGFTQPRFAYKYSADDSLTTNDWPIYRGRIDDALAFADKWCKVNVTPGSGVHSGTVADMFSNNNAGYCFKNTTLEKPVIIEIIPPAALTNSTISLGFSYGGIPKNVKIERASTPSGSYTTLLDLKDNRESVVGMTSSVNGTTVGKLRITLSEGIVNAAANPKGVIRVANICLYRAGYDGNYFVTRKGGAIYDDITFPAAKGIVLTSPAGIKYKVTIDDSGSLTATKLH